MEKQHDNEVAYVNDLRPTLDSILGPVLLAHGLVKDTRLASMQDARDQMEATAKKYGTATRARHQELLGLMQLENYTVSNGAHHEINSANRLDADSSGVDFSSHIRSYRSSSRPRGAGGNPQQDDYSQLYAADLGRGASPESFKEDTHGSFEEDEKALKEALAKMKGPLKQQLLDALKLQEAVARG